MTFLLNEIVEEESRLSLTRESQSSMFKKLAVATEYFSSTQI
jgi:hypothetical protein